MKNFIAAYQKELNVDLAEKTSGYTLQDKYPYAGFYVYFLIDPESKQIFYVGKGIGGRVLKHEERTRRGVLQNKEKVKRIQEIYGRGQSVVRKIFFSSEEEETVLAVENDVIHQLKGCGLTNIVGGWVVQSTTIQRMADELKARVESFRTSFIQSIGG